MISKWNWRVWKVSEIIYAQAFINGSRKSELPFLSKALSKVHEHALKYREYITAIQLNPNTSGEKMEQFYKKRNCSRHNFNIEEAGRQTGRWQSKSNLWVRHWPLEHTICKITNGRCEMAFFACQKTKETCFAISTAHPNNGTRV